ncbi:conserved hypothetical protein [Ricinus communis]|uniref:Uncharacterized protein n=1 Tax=Ricinus communis TaxID=3988 RepID=B9RYJ9_RICCO|nr:conserved hypothetical protein [Ricinus communis]
MWAGQVETQSRHTRSWRRKRTLWDVVSCVKGCIDWWMEKISFSIQHKLQKGDMGWSSS